MIFIIVAVFLAIVALIAFWKGVISKSADSLQDSGSGKGEAYFITLLVVAVLAGAVYMIFYVS